MVNLRPKNNKFSTNFFLYWAGPGRAAPSRWVTVPGRAVPGRRPDMYLNLVKSKSFFPIFPEPRASYLGNPGDDHLVLWSHLFSFQFFFLFNLCKISFLPESPTPSTGLNFLKKFKRSWLATPVSCIVLSEKHSHTAGALAQRALTIESFNPDPSLPPQQGFKGGVPPSPLQMVSLAIPPRASPASRRPEFSKYNWLVWGGGVS